MLLQVDNIASRSAPSNTPARHIAAQISTYTTCLMDKEEGSTVPTEAPPDRQIHTKNKRLTCQAQADNKVDSIMPLQYMQDI